MNSPIVIIVFYAIAHRTTDLLVEITQLNRAGHSCIYWLDLLLIHLIFRTILFVYFDNPHAYANP